MSLLFRIVRAAHATGTHHKLAVDALARLTSAEAEAWQDGLMVEAARLLAGAKAPDDQFKDFANHVLHPRDDFWGGAPEKVVEWYGRLVAGLRSGTLGEAAFAAGVLSHYVSDPFMPLHTGQSEAENAYHRAIEWSISRSYDRLVAEAEARGVAAPPAVDGGETARALKELVCRGAERANGYYEALLAHYDLAAGVVDPPSGLDARGRAMAGEMLIAARDAVAAVLSRAITEAGVAAPGASLAGPTLTAVLAIPRKLLDKRLADAADRAIVLAQYDELRATGHVDKTLDEDQRTVRDAYAAEVAPRRVAAQQAALARRLAAATPVEAADTPAAARAGAVEPAAAEPAEPTATPAAESDADAAGGSAAAAPGASRSLRERLEQRAGGDPLARLTPRPAPPRPTAAGEPLLPRHVAHAHPRVPAAETDAPSAPLPAPVATSAGSAGSNAGATALAAAVAASAAPAALSSLASLRPPTPPRIYLATTDRLDAAPSIGPKTAERLAAAGLATVADLIAADPDVVAAQAGAAHIDGDTVRDWQDQARLVLTIPGLRGGGAQLLVGAGYRALDAIATAEPDKLCADVLAFAATPAGHRILRDGQPPDIEKVKAWADAARSVAKAA